MKKFVSKIFLMYLFYFGIIEMAEWSSDNIGNSFFKQKIIDYDRQATQINTVFFGNSWINRQLNPIFFDSLTTSNTRSYNLATDATPFMERSFLLEKFLNKYQPKQIIFLVSPSIGIQRENLHHYRTCLLYTSPSPRDRG